MKIHRGEEVLEGLVAMKGIVVGVLHGLSIGGRKLTYVIGVFS